MNDELLPARRDHNHGKEKTVHEEEPETMEEIVAALEVKGLIEPARNADGSIQQRPDRFGRLQTVWVWAALDPRERAITAYQEEQLW